MAWLDEISLRNPWWLLLALQPIVLWLLAALRRRRRSDAFADAALLPWVLSSQRVVHARQLLRQLAILLAWCSLAIAMAGPRILQRIVGEDTSHYLTLQVLVDESYSMSARDILPSRLQRAVLELHDLIDRLRQVRMGIIVYAAHAHVMIPPTSDKSVLRQSLAALRVRELPSEGSDLFNALTLARQQLSGKSSLPRAILLISDGGLSQDTVQAQQRVTKLVSSLRQDNIHLYALGVGTARGAPLLNDQNGWLKQNGHTVVTRLHAKRLQRLAQLGNGTYAKVADDNSDWQTLYDDGIARLGLSARKAGAAGRAIWQDLSPWFVFPGLVLLLLAYLRVPVSRHQRTALVLLALMASGALLHAPASQAAQDSYARAYTLYQSHHYRQAARRFASLAGYPARMAEAACHYHLKQYPKAAVIYIQAVLAANSDAQRAAALFNLGNSYYKQADYARAAKTYRATLRYRPGFAAAKTNLAYAEALQQQHTSSPPRVGGRAGTGYHTAPAEPNTDVGKGRVSLDESSKPTAQTPANAAATAKGMNGKLLQQARPASQKIELDQDTQWTYDITHAQDISPADTHFAVDPSVFWQRLYEAEEGYPAPRQLPAVLPGIRPW